MTGLHPHSWSAERRRPSAATMRLPQGCRSHVRLRVGARRVFGSRGASTAVLSRAVIVLVLSQEGASLYSPAVERLITELAKLPGIGPRTAQRLTFHILRLQPEEILPLAAAIADVKEKIGFCRRCFNLAEGELCTICADTRRDPRAALRGRAAGRHRDHRAHARVPRPVPRPRRRAQPPRRRGPRRPAHRRAARARGRRGAKRSSWRPTRP